MAGLVKYGWPIAVNATDYFRFPGGRKKLAVLARPVLDEFPTRPRVLDVGCGNGAIAFPLAALGCEVVGVDVDRASIDWCNRHNSYPRAKFVLTSGTLREVEDPFDLIVCSEVLGTSPSRVYSSPP